MRNSNKSKFTVLFSGIIASLIILEIALRIIGAIHLHAAIKDKIPPTSKDVYVILCLGDSFTFGIGAPRDKCYPQQLEDLLNKEPVRPRVRVVNRGVGSYNTSMIANKLDKFINETNPDLIILLAGGANSWNAYGYSKYLNRNSCFAGIADKCGDIKVIKLINLLWRGMKGKTGYCIAGSANTARVLAAEQVFNRGYECEQEGRYDEAVSWYKKIIEKTPDSASAYHSIGRIYIMQGNREKAGKYLKKAIELNPGRTVFYTYFASQFVKDPGCDKEDLQFLKKYVNYNPVVKDIIEKVSDPGKYDQGIMDWITSDISRIIQSAQGRGVKIVIQNYPNYYERLTPINMTLKKIALKYSAPFVDNEQVFKELLLKNDGKDEYIAVDKAHCNEKGYRVMAGNVYNCIIKNKLIN
jgi:lysophospholipase L1-like esterase